MIVGIIPARGGSKRLERKNLRNVLGKPMMQWAIEACLNSQHIDAIFVTSEDEEILELAKSIPVNVITRPKELARDDVWTQDVLKHACVAVINRLKENNISPKISAIVRVQANSPQVTGKKIDECIEKLVTHNLWEVFTVDRQGIEDAAIHVLKARCVFQNALSVYKGVVTTDYIDIHTEEDLKSVESRMKINAMISDEFYDLQDEMKVFLVSLHGKSKKTHSWRIKVSVVQTYKDLLQKASPEDLEKIIENKEDNQKKRVLDLGCGFCPFWPLLEKQGFDDFTGVDLFSLRGKISGADSYLKDTEDFVDKFCKTSSKTRVIEDDIRHLSSHLEKDEKFDLIFTSNTDYRKAGSTGIPLELFDEVCKKYLAEDGIKIFNG